MPTLPEVAAAVVITAVDGAPVNDASLFSVVPVVPALAISVICGLVVRSSGSGIVYREPVSLALELIKFPDENLGILFVVAPAMCVETTVGAVPVPERSFASSITPTAPVVALETVALPVTASMANGAVAVTANVPTFVGSVRVLFGPVDGAAMKTFPVTDPGNVRPAVGTLKEVAPEKSHELPLERNVPPVLLIPGVREDQAVEAVEVAVMVMVPLELEQVVFVPQFNVAPEPIEDPPF